MNRNEAIQALRQLGPAIFNDLAPTPFAPGTWGISSYTDSQGRRVYSDGDAEITFNDVFPTRNKYQRDLKGVTVDVYDVLKAFNVTCPATQHALKKMLCAGLRGHKDLQTDLDEAIVSLQRAKELAK